MEDFISRVSGVLERPVSLDTRFRDDPQWCSLKAFGLLVTLENTYGKMLGIDEFECLETVGDLARAAGVLK